MVAAQFISGLSNFLKQVVTFLLLKFKNLAGFFSLQAWLICNFVLLNIIFFLLCAQSN